MANNPSLQPLEDVCKSINNLQLVLTNLDKDLESFQDISSKIEAINAPFPGKISNDLNIFYSGLQEVDTMIQELDKTTLDKLDAILTGASNGIKSLIAPIPGIVSDVTSINSLFSKVQSEISGLQNPSKGVDASIRPLNSKLASWSNTTPQDSGSDIGTGMLNAINSELNRAITDNNTLKNKYDTEINSIVSQINDMANNLSTPISLLSKDGGNLDGLIQNVNTYLNDYFLALNSVSDLSEKVDKVVSLLDKFKPDVDLVYGIVQPLGWFIELIESKTCNTATTLEIDASTQDKRLNHYLSADASPQSKFQIFEQVIDGYFQANNIGQKIGNVIQNMLPINDLKSAADTLNTDLTALANNSSVSNLLNTFSSIAAEIGNVQKELNTLNTDAVKAQGTVTFQRVHPNEDVTLQKGTSVKSTTGNIVFVTTENAVIKAGEFNSNAIAATAQAVGTSSNLAANAISIFVSTPVKQSDKTYKNESNPVYSDMFSISASSEFTGGTDMSVSQVQGEANDLANKMLPTLTRLLNR